jgi:hypothetical protein
LLLKQEETRKAELAKKLEQQERQKKLEESQRVAAMSEKYATLVGE